ncbi:hypothetical protein GRJ2_000122300 [Grus japonensis]|uniref:RNase H type-1 domain-containing protein n=1 Tax=Grus japonensis TaxID=30415 RepID=A0ABC9VUR0_GRUJA
MALPGVSGRKHRGRLEVNLWSFGVGDTEDLRPNTLQLKKEILAAYEGVRSASEVVDTEAQVLLAPRLPVLGWVFKGRAPSMHQATDATWRNHRRWKAAVWSPTRRVAEAAEGEGESSQFAEVKAIQLALAIAEQEKWPVLYLYTDSWMVANTLWGWLQQWKQRNWQHRGKPIWAAELQQDIAARLEKLVVKVCHGDAQVPKSRATEEHQNNQQMDQAAKIEVVQVDLDWQHKGELFIACWAHDTSGHQGRDAAYRWACDQGVDLTVETIAQVIQECETCTAIKQAKRLKPL